MGVISRTPALLLIATTSLGAVSAVSAAPPFTGQLPGFALTLAIMPDITGPAGWRSIPDRRAWSALADATPDQRQGARWNYARSLIGDGRASEALGVLDVMLRDDRDLALVSAWQLARGTALARMGRTTEALTALEAVALADNPEACAWRMRVMAESGAETGPKAGGQAGLAAQALAQLRCAAPALEARPAAERSAFIIAAARAAIGTSRPALALRWLGYVSDRDPAANLYRARAEIALGNRIAGAVRLKRVAREGDAEQRIDAELSTIEAASASGRLAPAAALTQLDAISYGWRGGDIELRALRLIVQLANQTHDVRRALRAGATLFRYFDLGAEAVPMIAGLQAQLKAALAPDATMPLEQAAGLYWDFRDLAPTGSEGDLLALQLADRLQLAGLYDRAAELLYYQLNQRARDLEQGPLSVKVASLYILAGRPDRAVRALRETSANLYPDDMRWDRQRIEAAALQLLGKTAEAMAVLQDVPDGPRIAAEIYWKKQDWADLVAVGSAALPDPVSGQIPGPVPGLGRFGEVEQAMVLRHAIALAMLGREPDLARLRSRYAASFTGLPSAATFEVLTAAVGAIDPAAIGKAMAALPSASPAGRIGDLLDVEPVRASRPAQRR